MLTRARRPTALLCIALLALNAVGCHQVNQREAQTVLQSGTSADTMKKVVGVTLKDGRDILARLSAGDPPDDVPDVIRDQ